MNVSLGADWEAFMEDAVRQGRYESASDLVREGLRLVKEREAKLTALRGTIEASIARGGSYSDEEAGAFLDAQAANLSPASVAKGA